MRDKVLLIALLTAWNAPASAYADGGTVRCSEQRDGLRITVFTAPNPLRAGIADVSVLVQDCDNGKPRLDVPSSISAYPVHESWRKFTVPTTADAATNKILRAAHLTFSEPGPWRIDVAVPSSQRGPTISFDLEVAEARPPWLDMSLWIAWPLFAIAVFAVHEWRKQRPASPRLVSRYSSEHHLFDSTPMSKT